MKLYYFGKSYTGMGHIPASTLTTDTSYSVTVNTDEDIILINGENEPRIYFTQGQKYLFEQSDVTNQEYRLTFPYYDTDSGTWIDTNTGITQHGVPGRDEAYTYFEPDTLAGLTRYCLVKDGLRKTTLIVPIVTIDDVSFGVLGKAYSGVPFTVTFTSVINDGSFNITDANGVAISLTSPTTTDLSYGTSSIDVTIGSDVSSGVMTISATDGITQTFDYQQITQTFVVTVGQVDSSDVFLIDGVFDVDLIVLENGKSYLFDLSYSQSYTFGLATDYDGANNSAYTDNVKNVSKNMIVLDVSASSSLYYYEKSDTVSNPNMGNRPKQWMKQGLDISGTSTLFPDVSTPFYFGQHSKMTPDGNTVVTMSPEVVSIFDWSGNEWKLRDYFKTVDYGYYGDAKAFRNGSEGGSVAISDDGIKFAYSSYNDNSQEGQTAGAIFIYTGWDGTQWGDSYSISGEYPSNGAHPGNLGNQNIEFSSDGETLLFGGPRVKAPSTSYLTYNWGIVYVYNMTTKSWGSDKLYNDGWLVGVTGVNDDQNDYTSFGYCADMTRNGKTVVGSSFWDTYNNDTNEYDGFFVVYDKNESTNSWDTRGGLVIADDNTSNNKRLGKFCKISNNGNMVALWTSNNTFLRIYYWNGSSWINTLFDNNGNSGLVIDTSVFNPSSSAVTAYGACFYKDGARVAIKGLSDSSYNIYFYAFNTSTNTWELDSTSPNFVLDDGMTPLGSDSNTRIINVSNDGNTLCIGNGTSYSNNGVLQVYKNEYL